MWLRALDLKCDAPSLIPGSMPHVKCHLISPLLRHVVPNKVVSEVTTRLLHRTAGCDPPQLKQKTNIKGWGIVQLVRHLPYM